MKTMLDLHRSAMKAADASVELNELDADKAAIAAFEADGGDPEDYRFWRQTWANLRNTFTQQKLQNTPSTIAKEMQAKMQAAAGGRGLPPGAGPGRPMPGTAAPLPQAAPPSPQAVKGT